MATTQQAAVTERPLPPYLPFTTFQTAIQNLRAHGLPDKLDKTAWGSRSGGDQSQIIAALKFFSLIDDRDNTQPSLRVLVSAEANSAAEKGILKSIFESAYAVVFEINLTTATIGQLETAIGSLGVTGATRDRAVRFFIKGSQHVGIPMSSRLTVKLRSRTDGSSSVSASATVPETETEVTAAARGKKRIKKANGDKPDGHADGNAVKTIMLRNVSGQLTLSGTFNPFDLDGAERKLVYDIIDLMKKYEQEEPT